jgi:hypothetical protein
MKEKKQRLCYISRNYRNLNGAGNKAKTDNEDTLQQMGATNLGLQRTLYASKVVTFFLDLIGVMRFVLTVRKDDRILLQYPVKKYFSFLCNVAHLRGAKTMALIHDLGSFRRKKLTVEKEISRLMHADYVIASNQTMKHWLEEHGYRHPMGSLGLFDYRSDAKPQSRQSSERPRLVYAGGLAMRKNAFLLKLAEQELPFEVHIYGNRDGLPGIKDNPSVIFHPFTPADTFIREAEGDFGFVWDGDSLDSCKGNFGEYLRWNSPHKVSFYIRAGLPIVIWKEASVASIIEKEGLGFSISSIDELEQKLKSLSPQVMEQMKANVRRVSERLANGKYLTEAVQQALTEL